jgi:hypothetical protein
MQPATTTYQFTPHGTYDEPSGAWHDKSNEGSEHALGHQNSRPDEGDHGPQVQQPQPTPGRTKQWWCPLNGGMGTMWGWNQVHG